MFNILTDAVESGSGSRKVAFRMFARFGNRLKINGSDEFVLQSFLENIFEFVRPMKFKQSFNHKITTQ